MGRGPNGEADPKPDSDPDVELIMCKLSSVLSFGVKTGTPGGWSSGQVRTENTDEQDEKPPARDGGREGTLAREESVGVFVPTRFAVLTGDQTAGRRSGKGCAVTVASGRSGLGEPSEAVDGGNTSTGVVVG